MAQERGGRGGGFPSGFARFSPLWTALDTDADGVISAAEIAAAPAALRALDKNRDGKLTLDEVRPAMQGGRGMEGRGGREGEAAGGDTTEETVKTLMAFDANGDGKLQKSELPERMQAIFERGDANHDGVLTPDEIRAMARAQQPTGASGRGGEREREGGRGRGGPEGMMRMDPIFAALDTNHDNTLSAEEIDAAPAALKTLDKNGDGKLTEDEVRPNFGPGRGFPGQPRDRQ